MYAVAFDLVVATTMMLTFPGVALVPKPARCALLPWRRVAA